MTTQTKVMTTGREASWIAKEEGRHSKESQIATPTAVPTWAREYSTDHQACQPRSVQRTKMAENCKRW